MTIDNMIAIEPTTSGKYAIGVYVGFKFSYFPCFFNKEEAEEIAIELRTMLRVFASSIKEDVIEIFEKVRK